MAGSLQGFLEELLGRSRVTFHGKPKINGSARGIDSTVQVPPVSALANVRFVDPPGAVGRFQFAPTSPVQFRGVALHPAPNGRVVRREISFQEQLLDIAIGQREPQIPTDGANYDLGFEMPPFEQRLPRFDHGIPPQPIRLLHAVFATLPKEVLSLNRDDLLLAESQIRVRGKGSKIRFLPLAPETVELLDHYLRLEHPAITNAAVFVSLKGRARGARMTPEGLRSLFRHHRVTTGIVHANPHRFRHTFASDMIRAGVSLPALMQLMGHSQIQTTLVYVQLTPLDVYQQYARAVKQHVRPIPPPEP